MTDTDTDKSSLRDQFHVAYNGVRDSTVGGNASVAGLHASSRPSVPAAREIINTFTIPGRDGALHIRDGSVEDIVISVDFSFSAYPDMWHNMAYAIRDWLLGHTGGTLRFTDLVGVFYKVKSVEISEIARAHKKVGTFTAAFTCDGYQYLDSGLQALPAGTLYNQYATAHPVYTIKATTDGTCTLTVGGKSVTATVAQNLTIDTDRMITYRMDGTNRIVANTALMMGNYDFKDLWIPRGSTAVSVSGSGFTLGIVPNWRRI